jgi:cysteinyl-tRNA synthetase
MRINAARLAACAVDDGASLLAKPAGCGKTPATMSLSNFSEAEREYLYTTRKRLMDLPRARIVNVQTPPAGPLTQVLSALGEEPAAVRDAVLGFLKAVNELCDGALRKHGRVNLSAVQAAEEGFVVLAKQLDLGTEDPVAYLRAVRDARAAQRQLDVAAVEATIRARAEARAAKDFETADRLQHELLAQGVVLLDHAQGTDWTLPASGPTSS